MRQCKKCGETKDINLFTDTILLGKSYRCKDCSNAYTRAYYQANRERLLLLAKERDKRYRELWREKK